jgi:glucose/arabinose dehydrogenase
MSVQLRRLLVVASAAWLLAAAVPSATSAAAPPIAFQRVATGLSQPVFATGARDGTSRLFIVEQTGRIRIYKSGHLLATPFLDIHTLVSCCGERGLLGLAFHPSFRTNGKFYVDYTDTNGNTVVAEYRRSSTNANRAAPSTRRVLLRITQPYANHNGGMLGFGFDGFLYISTGDGGSAGDPGNRAQSKSSLLGKILRIDVNGRTSTRAYRIPASNPFVGRTGLDQIWAYGLRNPWRFSFDRQTGDLWIGDVGQDRYEEIDRARRSAGNARGANYGWRVLEGFHCYNPSSGCNRTGKTMPLLEYSHSLGCSVTGGYVYRGSTITALRGWYIFGDYCSGRLWRVSSGASSPAAPQLLADTGFNISSLGQGDAGTLYIVDLKGSVYRIVPG